MMTDNQKQTDTRWALSPISGRYVLRTSTTYKRLVKGGFVHDPEVADQLARPATGTRPKLKGPNVILRAETDTIREVVAAAVAAEMAKLNLALVQAPAATAGAGRKKPPRRAPPPESDSEEEPAYTETSAPATEAEPPTEAEEPEPEPVAPAPPRAPPQAPPQARAIRVIRPTARHRR